MSFLNFNIPALPRSCQSAIQRTGGCGCLTCIRAVAPTPSSSASSSISESIKALQSGGSSETSSNNTSSTSVNQGEDNFLDISELHVLTILSSINKLRLERDAVEAARLASSEPIRRSARRQKRKAPDEEGVDIGMEDGLQILREIREMVEVVMERRRVVPVSQVRRWTELKWEMDGKGKERPVSAWGKVRGRLHLLCEGGRRKCWRTVIGGGRR